MFGSEGMTGKPMGKTGKKLIMAAGVGLSFVAATYVVDVNIRRGTAAKEAREYADSVGKPMLNVGAGTAGTALFGATTYGDVNCDIGNQDSCDVNPQACHCDITDMSQFPDKHFGSVLASHVVEHVVDYKAALAELHRVADKVFIITPSWWALHTWLYPDHKWYFPDGHGGGTPTRLSYLEKV